MFLFEDAYIPKLEDIALSLKEFGGVCQTCVLVHHLLVLLMIVFWAYLFISAEKEKYNSFLKRASRLHLQLGAAHGII